MYMWVCALNMQTHFECTRYQGIFHSTPTQVLFCMWFRVPLHETQGSSGCVHVFVCVYMCMCTPRLFITEMRIRRPSFIAHPLFTLTLTPLVACSLTCMCTQRFWVVPSKKQLTSQLQDSSLQGMASSNTKLIEL